MTSKLDSLCRLLRAAYADMDKEIASLLALHAQDTGEIVSCREGCRACCTVMATCTIAEGSFLARQIIAGQNSDEIFGRCVDHCLRTQEIFSPVEWYAACRVCPVYDEKQKSCQCYSGRPATCRCHFSFAVQADCENPFTKEVNQPDFRLYRQAIKRRCDVESGFSVAPIGMMALYGAAIVTGADVDSDEHKSAMARLDGITPFDKWAKNFYQKNNLTCPV